MDEPSPACDPQPITADEYCAYAPEDLELIDGYLFGSAEASDVRRRFLRLLLTNVGLREAVRLAPRAQWEAALRDVYGM